MIETLELRVLHVDDVDVNLRVMDQMLRVLGHDPVGVASGADAYRLMETMVFDLVLTDFHMPDVTGLDFLKNVRALRGPSRATPIIVVTADVMSFPGPALRDMGFAGALAKPVMVDAMRRVLASVLRVGGEFVGDGFARVQRNA